MENFARGLAYYLARDRWLAFQAVAPDGGSRRVALLGGVRARMAFKRLEDQRAGKVRIGYSGGFSDILDAFKEIPFGPSDPRTS